MGIGAERCDTKLAAPIPLCLAWMHDKESIAMSTESNKAAVRDFNATYNACDLDGVDKFTTQDTNWASKVLEQAFVLTHC